MASSSYRYRVDEAIPLSDHADHPGLTECVQRVRPKKILTVHGYTREFAAELRQHGYDAWSATGNDQIELQLAPPPARSALPASKTRTTASARHIRPICPLADFTSLCRLTGETSSRVEKIRHIAAYLRGLTEDVDLSLATRWLCGHALPDAEDRRTIRAGSLTLRSALLKLPGVREERYRELGQAHTDLAHAARLLLQELALKPEPLDLAGLDGFFEQLARAPGSLARIEQLAERLRTLHPAEGETVVRLLAGDLKIGIKPGLIEDAIAEAFAVDAAAVRHANMLSGDSGEVATLARAGKLDEATLRPFTPVKLMLATPMPDAPSLVAATGDLPDGGLWLEPDYQGIRGQLHKQGDRVALFSRDLHPLDSEFPELLDVALTLPGDFILDGEIIAHANGRQLTVPDLQKRTGRSLVAQTDLFTAPGESTDEPPVRFIAFDLLWRDGRDLLASPLEDRRAGLESLLAGPPQQILAGDVQRCPADPDALLDAFRDARAGGHGGLIAKAPGSRYSPGRRGMTWLELKSSSTIDCVVIAAERGSGRRAELLSDFTVAVRDESSDRFLTIGRVQSGLTDAEAAELSEHLLRHTLQSKRGRHQVEPNLVLEIAFDSVQPSKRNDSGFALRFPRIQGIRRNKAAADIDTLQFVRGLV
nr:MBL fold metallo-hydrolase RNA specificity domain-containing protein [Luteolibacter marinus]